MVRLMLVGVGVAMIVLSAALGRGGRLSMGHAAAWFWTGLIPLLLVAAASLLALEERVLLIAGLIWVAGAAIGFGLAQARAATRGDQHLRSLAQEVALLRAAHEPGAGEAPHDVAADERGDG
jgi:hypothetical protein